MFQPPKTEREFASFGWLQMTLDRTAHLGQTEARADALDKYLATECPPWCNAESRNRIRAIINRIRGSKS